MIDVIERMELENTLHAFVKKYGPWALLLVVADLLRPYFKNSKGGTP